MSKVTRIDRRFTLTKSVNDSGVFEGYASVFDTEDRHGDVVRKGAFAKGLAKYKQEKRAIKMLWQHNKNLPPIGITEAEEDATGLYFRGELTLDIQLARDVYSGMKAGSIDSVSIGAYIHNENVDRKTFKTEFIELELREISPVNFPALDEARIVSVKSLADGCSLSDVELVLRDAGGFSIRDAKQIISAVKGAPLQRDVDNAALAAVRNAIDNLKGVTL